MGATEPPDVPEGAIPESKSGRQLQLNPGSEDITAGPVVVYWYRNPGSGNYISNAPAEEGAGDDFPTDVGSVQVCDHGVWIYETIIPNDPDGFLFGSLEWWAGDEIHGMSSQAETVPDLPEFESGLASYSFAPWMTVDGATVITYDAALT